MSAHLGRPREMFVEALKVPTEARDAYLARACGGDDELLQRVRDLMEAHRGAGSFLDHPAPDLALFADEPSIAEGSGALIGPYKLLSEIGEGGMGLVFLAEQEQPLRRKVALKVIKPGLDTRQTLRYWRRDPDLKGIRDDDDLAGLPPEERQACVDLWRDVHELLYRAEKEER